MINPIIASVSIGISFIRIGTVRNLSRIIAPEGLLRDRVVSGLDRPYFIPEGTSLNTQLRNFQTKKLRLGIVVDEYGDVMGLVAVADILEEIVGDFTSNLNDSTGEIFPQRDGSFIIDGGASVRDVNKGLRWELPTDGPKTISGLILEYLEAFPDGNVVRAVRGREREAQSSLT